MRRLLHICVASLLAVMVIPRATGAELANLRNGFSIRAERHETVGEMTRLYTGSAASAGYIDVPTAQIESFEVAPAEIQPASSIVPTNPTDLRTLVNSASERSQVDADFIASVIHAESGNNPKAVSRKGAQGLMQLMPSTANKLGVKDSFDPAANVDGGVRYLRELLLLYNNDMVKALAAYNAGPLRVQQYKGVPPYRETHAYVARVITDYNRKKLAQRRQLQPSTSRAPLHAKAAHVATPTSAPRPHQELPATSSIAQSTSASSGSE